MGTVGYKRTNPVTIPMLSVKEGVPVLVKIISPMYVSDVKVDNKEPATVARVWSPESGGTFILMCGAVIQKELEKAYPNDGYVGRFFEITRGESGKKAGKNWVAYTIFEVELTDDDDDGDELKPGL